jgi:D-alanyl-D-alanine carboxypeptidase (penicillin-binding protein 5/6)
MRTLFLALLLPALLAAAPARAQLVPPPPALAGKSWVLLDDTTRQFLVMQAPEERVEPASLTKLMTAYLVFQALKQGSLKPEQTVAVSERAWKATGSRMFIEPRKPVTVDELIRGMIIISGNDASIALAEAVAGTEDAFAQLMNREAQRMGLKNTRFVNATGLPDAQHYSTARDLALLASAVIRDFPEYYPLYSEREYRYNNIRQSNRNRLLWSDPTVDGMKTGFTEAAGYCLVSSAKRGERRLVSVVLGTGSDSARAAESQKLLNYGFQYYDLVRLYGRDQKISDLKVFKGSSNTVPAGFRSDLLVAVPKGMGNKLQAQLESQQPLLAPLDKDQAVGTLRVTLDGKPIGDYPVLALEGVPVAGIFGRAWDSMRLLFK